MGEKIFSQGAYLKPSVRDKRQSDKDETLYRIGLALSGFFCPDEYRDKSLGGRRPRMSEKLILFGK
jgi:hypothetical protein